MFHRCQKFTHILSDLSEAVAMSRTMLFDGWLFFLSLLAQAKNNIANSAITESDTIFSGSPANKIENIIIRYSKELIYNI